MEFKLQRIMAARRLPAGRGRCGWDSSRRQLPAGRSRLFSMCRPEGRKPQALSRILLRCLLLHPGGCYRYTLLLHRLPFLPWKGGHGQERWTSLDHILYNNNTFYNHHTFYNNQDPFYKGTYNCDTPYNHHTLYKGTSQFAFGHIPTPVWWLWPNPERWLAGLSSVSWHNSDPGWWWLDRRGAGSDGRDGNVGKHGGAPVQFRFGLSAGWNPGRW